ncbi:MAG: hypothetical protein HY810_04755 [Candidatus Omnitrophica bacterium]|nr:hypothetical protein [Candidatus Omnitrophota bacterium]
MAVLILAFVLIPLLSQFYSGFQGNITAQLVTQSIDLANELMEEIKSRRFDENTYPNEPVNIALLGIDSGEVASNRQTFDDIDDYNGWNRNPPQSINSAVLSDFAQFTTSVIVEYVTISGNNWITASSATNYKRITVNVSHPKIATRQLLTIMSHY